MDKKGPIKKAKIETNVNGLPPLHSLDPKLLKNFNRTELSSYLQEAGFFVSQADSKPALKKAIRHLQNGEIDLVRETLANPDEKIDESDLVKETFKDKALNAALSVNSSFGLPSFGTGLLQLNKANFFSFDENENFEKKNLQNNNENNCIDCHKKKANRECIWSRCKQCCAKANQTCHVHRIDPQNSSQNFSNFFAQNFEDKFSNANQNENSLLNDFFTPMKKCPSCEKWIFNVASNFWHHLKSCDFEMFLKIWDLPKKEKDEIILDNQITEEPIGVDLVKENFKKKKEKTEFILDEIFSPVSIHQPTKKLKNLNFSDLENNLKNQIKRLENDINQLKEKPKNIILKNNINENNKKKIDNNNEIENNEKENNLLEKINEISSSRPVSSSFVKGDKNNLNFIHL